MNNRRHATCRVKNSASRNHRNGPGIFLRRLSPGAEPRKNFKEHFGSAPIQVNALAYTPNA
jgi:hypothetical protein